MVSVKRVKRLDEHSFGVRTCSVIDGVLERTDLCEYIVE